MFSLAHHYMFTISVREERYIAVVDGLLDASIFLSPSLQDSNL